MKETIAETWLQLDKNLGSVRDITNLAKEKLQEFQLKVAPDVFHYLRDSAESFEKKEDTITLSYHTNNQITITMKYTFEGTLLCKIIENNNICYSFNENASEAIIFHF